MYSNFSFYQNTFNGLVITTETEFNQYAERGSIYIDNATLGKASADSEFITQIKKCECRIAELLAKDEENNLSSESVGGYTKSYKNKSNDNVEEHIHTTIVLYLGRTGLLCLKVN